LVEDSNEENGRVTTIERVTKDHIPTDALNGNVIGATETERNGI
jgi:hypothetical protein